MAKTTRQSRGKRKTMPIVKQKGAVGPLRDDLTIYRSLRNLFSSQGEVVKPYSQSVWVYATIKSIAMNISRTPFVAYQGKYGEAEEKEVIEWPEEYKVFSRPNPFMSMEMLIEAVSTYLDLRGEAFLILEGRNNVSEMPKEIWTFDPLRFDPIFVDKGKTLIGWKYVGLEDVPFALHEIVHIKYFNPYDDYRGISPLIAGQMAVDQEYFANQYNKAFFKEGAPTGGFIEVEEGLTEAQYNRLLLQFEDRHKGASKAHRIGILEGGGKFVEARITQKDMDFLESKKMNRTEIFATFKANPVAMGIYEEVKSYEGVKEARKSFWQECIIPRQELIVNTLWWSLFSKIGSGQIWGEFDRSAIEALQEDFDKKLAAAERMANMGWPINAINKKLGLGMEDVPWGDVTWKPIGMMPVSSPEGTTFPVELPNEELSFDKLKKEIKELNTNLQIKTSFPATVEIQPKIILPVKFTLIKRPTQNKSVEAEVHWKIFLTKQIPLEKTFHSKVKRFLFEQRSRVLEKLHSSMTKDLSDEIFNEDSEVKAMQKLIKPLYELSLKDGAEMAAEQVGNASFVFNPLDKDFLGYMEMRVAKIPSGMVTTIKDQLREAITEGITLGETVNELAERVKGIYNVASSRALTIARTESASSINAGRFIQLEKEGVKKHEWVTALDEAVRDSHKALEGSVAEIGEEFEFRGKGGFSGGSGLRYPGDMNAEPGEVINCRCTTVAVIKTEEVKEEDLVMAQVKQDFDEYSVIDEKGLDIFYEKKFGKDKGQQMIRGRKELLNTWLTSSSSEPSGLLKVFAEEFGFAGKTEFHRDFLNSDKEKMNAFLKRVEAFKKEYIKELPFLDLEYLFKSIYELNQRVLDYKYGNEMITLYRGVNDSFFAKRGIEDISKFPNEGEIYTNSLSSWTLNKKEAENFGRNVFEIKVKKEDVFASPVYYPFRSEEEFVIFGKNYSYKLSIMSGSSDIVTD